MINGWSANVWDLTKSSTCWTKQSFFAPHMRTIIIALMLKKKLSFAWFASAKIVHWKRTINFRNARAQVATHRDERTLGKLHPAWNLRPENKPFGLDFHGRGTHDCFLQMILAELNELLFATQWRAMLIAS